MTLLELCDPLFQYICRLNRAGRKGGHVEFTTVRSEVIGLFDELRNRSATDFKLASQFKAMEMPLIFFVDSLIAESKLPCARQWTKERRVRGVSFCSGGFGWHDHEESDLIVGGINVRPADAGGFFLRQQIPVSCAFGSV